MARDLDAYPHELAGGEAPPPVTPDADLVQAWRVHLEEIRAEEAAALEDDGLLAAAGDNWRPAASLVTLLEETNAAYPDRDRRSDGGIGDRRHWALPLGTTDHVPWLEVAGVGVLRARDFDTDGLPMAAGLERGRRLAAAGDLPQVIGGGYFIYAGRITAPDFRSWREYLGENPHVPYAHLSVSRDPRRFDDRRPWGLWTPRRRPDPRPPANRPATPPPASRPPADLTGRGVGLRGAQGAAGPRVAALQGWFRRNYPAYARGLAVDGAWGPATSSVLAQFAHRSRIREADGANIGPRIARALHLAGFRG